MKKIIKKKEWERHGVSEVVGNLLILAITVTLFSSIMYFVTSMPAPNEEVYADFSSNLSFDEDTHVATIAITHSGGQTLKDYRTGIYLFIDGIPKTLTFADSTAIGDEWKTGETFTYNCTGVMSNTSLSIMIVDIEANALVWDSVLKGQQTGYPPIIKNRGLKKAGEPVNSPYYTGNSVQFYADITDFDDDLNYSSIYLDASSIGLGTIGLSFDTTTNLFVSSSMSAVELWNGKTVVFYASDLGDRTSNARATLSVTTLPSGGGGGGGGEPPGNLDYGALQGFGMFEWADWEENGFLATPTTVFERGQRAVIVVASKYVVNFNTENLVRVLNETSKLTYYAVSTPNNQFSNYDVISGYYVYNCSIDTSLLPDITSYYLIQAGLTDNWIPNNVFTMNARMYVYNETGSSVPGYPQILTFSDPDFETLCNDFTTYDPSNNKIYVEIRNNLGASWDQYTGDVEIRDFFWNYYVKGTPKYVPSATGEVDWNGPISNLWQVTTSPAPPGVYRFVINLANATIGSPWLLGQNSYVLRYDMFKAGPETYILNKLVKIDAPTTKLDIVVGGAPSNTARFAEQNSLYFYTNDNQWSPPQFLETCNDKQLNPPTILFTRAGDINGDGKTDSIAVIGDTPIGQTFKNIYLYVYLNQGGSWIKSIIATLSQKPIGVELGNIDYDGDLDVIVAYSDIIHLYRNNGAWSRTTVATSSTITSLYVADMDPPGVPGNDPTRSQDIVVGRADGTFTIYRNQYGDGTSWASDTLGATGAATVYDWANGEQSVIGTVIGDYTKTQNPYQDDGIFEQITETINWRYNQVYPTIKHETLDTVDDPVTDLSQDSLTPPSRDYTVLYNRTAMIVGWDNTGMVDDLPIYSAKFELRYKTTNYAGGHDSIVWNDGGSLVPILEITDSSEYMNASFDLTSYFDHASDMTHLNISFYNSIIDSAVDFEYWRLNVTWKIGDWAEHIWTFTVTPGTSHEFNVYAVKSSSIDSDNFQFYYSTDSVEWFIMDTCQVTNTGLSMVRYSYVLPASIYGELYIKVVDTGRALSANPSLDWVKVGQMYVKTSASSTSVGTSISAMAIADVDGNGANDVVLVSTKGDKGQLFVLYNRAGGILSPDNLHWVIIDDNNIKGASWVDAGQFFNPYNKEYLDIIIGVTTKAASKVYFVSQDSPGTFGELTQMDIPLSDVFGSEFKLIKMTAGDVDGNRRTDLLFGTEDGYILLFANYEGTDDISSGWQVFLIDHLEGGNSLMDIDTNRSIS